MLEMEWWIMLEMEWWILLEILAAAMTRLYGCCICVIKAY